jgi:23S rRNA G2069 N7-methylase RlmK/C1962 C5-methylase RlmI
VAAPDPQVAQWRARWPEAQARRAHLHVGDFVRWVDQSADGLPGIVVDQYGRHVRVELNVGASEALLQAISDDVDAASVTVLQRTAAGKSQMRVVRGNPPVAHVVHERGLRLLVRIADEAAAGSGAFVDQRETRALLRRHSRGARVLNLFAHAGGFSAAAAAGGAARIDTVDAARKCALWAATNIALNGVDPRLHRFIVDDALAFMDKVARRGERYDIIVCDPPTQATATGGHFVLQRSMDTMLRTLASMTTKLLVFSCNDRDVTDDDLMRLARPLATEGEVSLLPLPPDVSSRGREQPMRGMAVWRTRQVPT